MNELIINALLLLSSMWEVSGMGPNGKSVKVL